MLIEMSSDIVAHDGSVIFRMYKNSVSGSSGGFAKTSRKKVCEFIKIDTNEHIGCLVIPEIDDIGIAGHFHIYY